jgi:hypothetical protein
MTVPAKPLRSATRSVVLEHEDRRALLQTVEDASQAEVPHDGEPFVCAVWDAIGGSTAEERIAFGRRLVAAGCRYTVSGGDDCGRWHDDMDVGFVELPEAEWDARFLMSSWHTGETLEQVIWYAFACTGSEELTFRRWLVVLRGGDEALRQRVERAVAAEIEREEEEQGEDAPEESD